MDWLHWVFLGVLLASMSGTFILTRIAGRLAFTARTADARAKWAEDEGLRLTQTVGKLNGTVLELNLDINGENWWFYALRLSSVITPGGLALDLMLPGQHYAGYTRLTIRPIEADPNYPKKIHGE